MKYLNYYFESKQIHIENGLVPRLAGCRVLYCEGETDKLLKYGVIAGIVRMLGHTKISAAYVRKAFWATVLGKPQKIYFLMAWATKRGGGRVNKIIFLSSEKNPKKFGN